VMSDYKEAWERRLRNAEASNQFTDNDQSIRWAGKRIAELEAENKALIDANVEVANINAGLLVEVEALREALETISRLEPYDGNRHVYHSAGKVARKALAL